jgi:membrane associated rhomboid family serine protease
VPTIGASGAIYGLLMGCAVLFPQRRVWMFPFPGLVISMRMFAFIWGAIEFFGTFTKVNDGVSHIAHLSGMLVGWLYLRRGSLFFGVRNRISDWKRSRLRRKFEVYMREHKDEPPSRPDNWLN